MTRMEIDRLELLQSGADVIIPVRATPGAKRSRLSGVHNGALKVAVTAAAERGKANRAIVALLAKALGVAKSRIEIASGALGGNKRIRVRDSTTDAIRSAIAAAHDPGSI